MELHFIAGTNSGTSRGTFQPCEIRLSHLNLRGVKFPSSTVMSPTLKSQNSRIFFDLVTSLLAVLLALLGWAIIGLLTLAWTEGTLAPWDTSQLSPPPGTLSFFVNRFFESGIGSYLPALLIVGISSGLFLRGIQLAHNVTSFFWKFVLTQILFLSVVTLLLPFIHTWSAVWLQGSTTIHSLGYEYNWPAILFYAFNAVLLLSSQWKLVNSENV